jgi:glycosyltransferase involved in cell wall biosynthesis
VTSPPKLLVVIGTLARMGGAERQALYLVEYLSQLPDCHVEVLSFEDGSLIRRALHDLGVPVHVVSYSLTWTRAKRAKALSQLLILLRRHIKPEAILPFGSQASKSIGLIWRYSGASFMWWNQQDEGRGRPGTKATQRILEGMPSIISNSFAGRDYLSGTYSLSPDRVLVYNNGTPLEDGSARESHWRRDLKLEGRTIVAMIANVTRFKDHETLLKAWVDVKNHYSDRDAPVLLLAGHLKRRAFVSQLKNQAFDSGLSGKDVRFLGAMDDVPGLLREVDLVVHSSVAEGCPNAVCEAMAAGRAVVATDISGCRQALGDSSDQWLAEPRNAKMLAERIIASLESDDSRRQAGEANRERIRSEFSVAGMNDFFVRQIESGLGRSLRGTAQVPARAPRSRSNTA